jgi:hypothetical protein
VEFPRTEIRTTSKNRWIDDALNDLKKLRRQIFGVGGLNKPKSKTGCSAIRENLPEFGRTHPVYIPPDFLETYQ